MNCPFGYGAGERRKMYECKTSGCSDKKNKECLDANKAPDLPPSDECGGSATASFLIKNNGFLGTYDVPCNLSETINDIVARTKEHRPDAILIEMLVRLDK